MVLSVPKKALGNGPNAHLLVLERELREEYWVLNQQEEEFWSVKSKYNWLIQEDRNTNFFHTSVLIQRKRNRLYCFKDSLGNLMHNEEIIASIIREGYISLFTTCKESAPISSWDITSWHNKLSSEEGEMINYLVTERR